MPLMEWQRMVADVGGEIDPHTGLPAYREVIFTVPRQSGKTTLILGWEIQRALGWGSPQRVAYSAQDGTQAAKKLIEDQFPILDRRKKVLGISNLRKANGRVSVEFRSGSRIGLLASTAEAGHGQTLDLGIKDEFWADYDDRRDQAMVPAMATKPAAQVLTASTMGTEESVPLNRAVERGRLAVETGVRSGIAYFEWSAPEDEDPDDPATWWGCMPALGNTITEGVVRHARQTLTDGEFRRAFLNQRTKAENRVLPVGDWNAVCSAEVAPKGSPVFALDINPERSAAAVVAASGDTAELIQYREGTDWVVAYAKERSRKWSDPTWFVDAQGPAGSFIPELEREHVKVHPVTAREMIDACGKLYDGVVGRKIRLRTHAKLNEAAAGAAKRTVGDAWAWTRRNASADICPLVAATLALWGAGQWESGTVNLW